jgi:lipopolysaccharide transport system ATP-binding protein
MSVVAIQADRLGKQYRIGRSRGGRTVREVLVEAARAPLRRMTRWAGGESRNDPRIWALRDISFEVQAGEAVGIIGGNGAGKSTLLKILSRITNPTEGWAEIRGRVGSLLEVGTGFHSELTGRENIYLNGAILGMKRAEIACKFDEIVAFAEVETFLDTPVKHYSSGMYMRLAFAVAAHLEPEILIVDEVLAVGDAAFQKRCIGKMSHVASHGRTVVFVSHNMAAIQRLCQRAIWLRSGRMAAIGPADEVVARYVQESAHMITQQLWLDPTVAPGNEKVRLRRAALRPLRGSPTDPITVLTEFVLEFEYWNLQPGARLSLSVHLYNDYGVLVLNTFPVREPAWHGRPFPAGLFRSGCRVPGNLLNDGTYRVELLVVRDQGVVLHREPDVLVFEVRDAAEMRADWYGRWPGVVRPALDWTTELVSAGTTAECARNS